MSEHDAYVSTVTARREAQRQNNLTYYPWTSVACPRCKAQPGDLCRTRTDWPAKTHAARHEAYAAPPEQRTSGRAAEREESTDA